MTYSVFIQRSAQESLAQIPKRDQDRIFESIRALALEPRPHGVKKLSGRDAWRIRIGDYRIIYEIQDVRLLVLVVAIGHRKEIYR